MGWPAGDEVDLAEWQADQDTEHRRGERRVEERTGRTAIVGVRLALDEDKAGVRHSGPDTEDDAEERVLAECALADHTADQHDAEEDDRHRDCDAPRWPLPEDEPGDDRHHDDLRVAEHGGQSGTDLRDRVVPENQVGGEEGPGDPRQAQLPGGASSVSAPLIPGEQGEWRERVEAAEDRSGGRGRVGVPDQDRAEGDRQRAEHGGEHGPAGERPEEGSHPGSVATGWFACARTPNGGSVRRRRHAFIGRSLSRTVAGGETMRHMSELPSGTVTFLFSDIEGSTRLVQALGAAWPAQLDRHRELLIEAFQAHGGVPIGSEGDSLFVAFPSAAGAVEAAIAGQRALAAEPWPAGNAVRVRIGMHSGEASLATDTYVGLDVHRAARIAAAGHGGQVLISQATRGLVDQSLPEAVELRDLGEHRLKDLVSPEHLWQIVAPGLETEFPAIGSLDATPNNLPTRLTTFLGREREIAEVSRHLADARLLTLTGPGGTGKTRLSLEVAVRTMSRFPDGVWFVELAPISEPDLVLATIAQTLGLPDRGGRTPLERLLDHIGDKQVLLVLDNFEQVVSAATDVSDLLGRSPNLTVLASSRSVLHVYAEREFPVPPLGLPDPRHLPDDLGALRQYEAVALFIERARAIKPDFVITNENAAAVAEICVRLDGLPLAIELAAARIRILPPQAMLARLERRLSLLSGGPAARDLPARQQTLRGAIEWSHDMLEEPDRALFAGLSVFVGGASIEAAERVCGDEVEGEILDRLASLVDKSLLRQSEGIEGEARFTMLETIREFAMEQAEERGRWAELRMRHAELFCEVAETAAGPIMGSAKRGWLDRLEQDHDNLRAALTWATESQRPDVALRMSFALWRFWQMRGYLAEGVERTAAALAMPGAGDHPALRANALSGAAGLAYWQADTARSRAWYEQEIEARRELGDRAGLAEALYGLSFTYSFAAGGAESNEARAETIVSEALEIFRELDDRSGIARCLWAIANIAWASGDRERAMRYASEALPIFREADDRFMVGWSVYTMALYDLGAPAEGDVDRAEARLAESLRIFAEADDVTGYALVLDALALLALRRGDLPRAARLSGGVAGLERLTGTGLNLPNRKMLGFEPLLLREDPDLAAAWDEGERTPFDELVEYALAGCRAEQPARDPA
jgi:predicted ATPase/class 3 adenylate cyclase